VHLAPACRQAGIVQKMKIIAIKKQSSKLKDWSVEMPNAPYSKR